MRISYSYKGIIEQEKVFGDDVIVGRLVPGVEVDLDLKFDRWVSHRHARIWVKEGQYWIEDLGSRNGTTVNGEDICGKGSRGLQPGDTINIGETKLSVKIPAELPKRETSSNITLVIDAKRPAYSLEQSASGDAERRLAILYELPLQFGEEMQLDLLLQMIVVRLVEIIRGSARAALILKDPVSGALLLKAHIPLGKPYVSMTLAQRALEQRVGFIWQRAGGSAVTQADASADCAMYAPLLWKGKALGVVSVDNYQRDRVFDNDDLRLLVAGAQYAAMAVANQLLQEELRRESAIKSNLLRQFSPKIAERLLNQRGRFRLGGERCEVTILCSDICGFTTLSKEMEPESVVEMLNDYFSGLIPVIFAHDGSVDKYVGDAILSVFGSPGPDPEHYEKAVRAALGMQEKMRDLNAARRAEGKVTCNIGIGVHCGEVVHGFVGALEPMGFTVIGDAVNRASRFCDGAHAGEVVISPELYQRVWRIIQDADAVSIDTKENENLNAYLVKSLKQPAARDQ
ncbi:MAG: FHA domain-containing protein [Deltaproteobacteria bacterium]|nr:FHA domain-containing protein [Deltaproteobacteria bacterium]